MCCFIHFWNFCVLHLHSLYRVTCVFVLDWSAVCVNIGVTSMGITHVKWAILGILFASSTPLYQRHQDATNIGLDEPGPHMDTISWLKRLYWIKFPWTVIGEDCTIAFCRLRHSCLLLFGDVRSPLLIYSDSSHFDDVSFIKKVNPISVPPSFRPWLSPKHFGVSTVSFGDRSICQMEINIFNIQLHIFPVSPVHYTPSLDFFRHFSGQKGMCHLRNTRNNTILYQFGIIIVGFEVTFISIIHLNHIIWGGTVLLNQANYVFFQYPIEELMAIW